MKVKFLCSAWPQLREMDTGFLKDFKNKYGAKLVDNNADIVFYENCKIDSIDSSKCRIFITGENTQPNDCEEFDLVIGFKNRTKNSYQLPLWTFSVDWDADATNDWSVSKLTKNRTFLMEEERKRFCGFISCNARQYRMDFVQKLSKYKNVTCAGKVMNNFNLIGSNKDDKKVFLQTCKFGIAFENDDHKDLDGYVTEKIIDAFVAGAIPIYCGDPNITRVFNSKAFLNRGDFKNDEDFINAIIEVDSNDELYQKLRSEPIFVNNQIPRSFYPKAICDKIVDIFTLKQTQQMVTFRYGAANSLTNVTNIAKEIFVDDGKISIPSNISFNDVFGDVLPGVEKHLKIENQNNGSVITLPEVRNSDFLSFVTCKVPCDLYTKYTMACRLIVAGYISDWKQNKYVNDMLEHESVYNASIYLQQLYSKLDKNIIANVAAHNDRVGSPSIVEFNTNGEIIRASPSSIRYVKHAFDILTIAKSKNVTKLTVVEVGGGYGGLALTLTALARHFLVDIVKYIIYDLDAVKKLQKYYLSQHNLSENIIWGDATTFARDLSSIIDSNDTHIMLVSNYCMSEIDETVRKNYLGNLLPHANSAYMRWNFASHNDLPSTYNIVQEVPDTGSGNTVVSY